MPGLPMTKNGLELPTAIFGFIWSLEVGIWNSGCDFIGFARNDTTHLSLRGWLKPDEAILAGGYQIAARSLP